MFTKAALVFAIAGFAVAAPAPETFAAPPAFTVVVETNDAKDGIHGAGVVAKGSLFFINDVTSVSCDLEDACNNYGTETSFNARTDGTVWLNSAAPGGQQVFVTAERALAFTAPFVGPTSGGQTSPFTYTPQPDQNAFGQLTFKSQNFAACPNGVSNADGTLVYQLFDHETLFTNTDCRSVTFRTSNYFGLQAFKYV